MLKFRFLLVLLLFAVFAAGCKFKVKDGLSWDQELVAPILKSRIGLEDALKDSSIVQVNPDNSITLVYRDTLVDIRLSDYLVVPDTTYAAKIKLDSITLKTDTITQVITMAQIAQALCDDGQTIFCNLTPGQWIPPLPPFVLPSAPDQAIDASQFFTEADLITGWMVVQLQNDLPMDIDSASFLLKNDGNYTDTLVQKTMYDIDRGTTKKDSASLADKIVESSLLARIENIATAASPPFNYDPNASLTVRIIVHSLRARRATAVFPAQRVIDDYSRINYNFDNGVEITKIKARSGTLRMDAYSTLQDTIAFSYALPTAIKNGQSVIVYDRLIPQPGGAEAHINLSLADYYIDMTLNGDSVNLFPYHLIGDLLYSGVLNTMDLNDSIDINYGLEGIVPAYIEGYLGETNFNFADSIQFDFFNAILGGDLDLKNPKVTLSIRNSIGVDAKLIMRQLEAINHRKNQTVPLTGTFMSQGSEVRGPRLPNVGQTVETNIVLDHSNSNIRQFLSLLPDELQFDMDVEVNKNGNPALHDNFATDQSALSAFLDIEVPLHGIAEWLWLQDTLDLNLSKATLPPSILEAQLKMVLLNQFPLSGHVQVLFVDQGGAVFDSLFPGITHGAFFSAGIVNANGYVDTPTPSTVTASFDQPRFTMLKQRGKRAIVRFKLSTKPNGQAVKLFTTYGIDFHLVGDFTHHVGT